MTWLKALPSNVMHGNMGIQHSWNPYCEQANWGRKECVQLEGSEEAVVVEEEERQKQVAIEELQAQVELAVGTLVQVAIISKLAFVY